MVLLQRISFQVLHLVCKAHNHINCSSNSRWLKFCKDKQERSIKKNYEDNACNRGIKSGMTEELHAFQDLLGMLLSFSLNLKEGMYNFLIQDPLSPEREGASLPKILKVTYFIRIRVMLAAWTC